MKAVDSKNALVHLTNMVLRMKGGMGEDKNLYMQLSSWKFSIHRQAFNVQSGHVHKHIYS